MHPPLHWDRIVPMVCLHPKDKENRHERHPVPHRSIFETDDLSFAADPGVHLLGGPLEYAGREHHDVLHAGDGAAERETAGTD